LSAPVTKIFATPDGTAPKGALGRVVRVVLPKRKKVLEKLAITGPLEFPPR